MRSHRATALLIALLLSAVVALASYRLSPWQAKANEQMLAVVACDPAQRDCPVDLPGGGQLVLSLQPRPIRPLRSFRVLVSINGNDAQQAALEAMDVDFDGTSMSMGNIRRRLTRLDNVFAGEAILPVCISGSMEWAAIVRLPAGHRRIAIPFHFVVAGH